MSKNFYSILVFSNFFYLVVVADFEKKSRLYGIIYFFLKVKADTFLAIKVRLQEAPKKTSGITKKNVGYHLSHSVFKPILGLQWRYHNIKVIFI